MRKLSLFASALVCAATLATSLTALAGVARVAPGTRQMPPMTLPHSAAAKVYMHVRGYYHGGECCGKLVYGGGPVLNAPEMYVILWGFKKAGDPDKIAKLMKKFAKSIGGTPWLNTVTQYYSGSASEPNYITNPTKLGKVWEDNTNRVPLNPSDKQVQQEAAQGANHFGFDPNGAYIVVSPYNNDPQGFLTGGWCSYHSATRTSKGIISYTNMPYMPDGGSTCGAGIVTPPSDESSDDEGMTIVTGYEFAESVTDPQPASGWYDGAFGEIGTECAWTDVLNSPMGKGSFTTQPLFSNATDSCVQTYP
jgi:hypothetical protein